MINRFIKFIKNNAVFSLCIVVSVLLVYFVKLSAYTVGFDTELFMGDADYRWFNWKDIGRFGLIFLKTVFSPDGLNIRMADGLAVFFLIPGTLMWSFFILEYCALFNRDSKNGSENFLILFPGALFFLTSGVWQEQIYYQLQSAEVMFIVFLCPVTVMLLADGIKEESRLKTVIASLLLTFMLSVYQAVIMMLVAAVLIFLYSEEKREGKIPFKHIIRAGVSVIGALVLYFILSRVFKDLIFHAEDTGFLSGQIRLDEGRANPLFKLAGYIYMLFFANTGFLSPLVDSLIASHAATGADAVDYYHSAFSDIASVLYIPAVLLFLIRETGEYLRKIREGRKKTEALTALTVSFLIPLSVLAFPVIGAGDIKVRVQFVLPLVAMFLFMYCIDFSRNLNSGSPKNHAGLVLAVVIPLTILYSALMQGSRVSMLFMSDLKVFENDKTVASDLNTGIRNEMLKENLPEDTPVYILGIYEPSFDGAMTHGEYIGRSAFSRNKWMPEGTTLHAIALMRVLGYGYVPCRSLSDEDRDAAGEMPAYPADGYVKYINGKIIVKIAE